MMDGSGRACSVCSQRCELAHGNYSEEQNDVVDDPVLLKLISFFKVMIDPSYSKLLFLPPKFARQISNMVGERIQLEDITRKKWTVTVSEVEGSLAFEKGWDYFSKDHNLEIGDLLVFELAKSCHFLVQIFDRTGCPRFNFSMNNNNNMLKRKRNNNTYVQDQDNSNIHATTTTTTTTTTAVVVPHHPVLEMNYVEDHPVSEETFHMINRVNNTTNIDSLRFHDQELGRRNLLLDLSCFEKPKRMFQTESIGRTPRLLCDSVYKPPRPKERRKTTPFVEDNKIVVRNHQAIVVGEELPLSVKTELYETNEVPRLEFNGYTMSISWKGFVNLSRGLEDTLTVLSSKRSKIILLRARDTLPLPVLYHEGGGSKYIGNGWQFFLNENKLPAGDCFLFKLENRADFIFSLCDRK